ncbi:MAG: hypothetical protein CMJ89_04535 [Planctomycetes bacterium]|nr:hypothetical protein [Planctomycetota bacterium]
MKPVTALLGTGFTLASLLGATHGGPRSPALPQAPSSDDGHARAIIDFENDLIPLFTKVGCNTGGCHGAAIGRGGFHLSLLGGNPSKDYETIVHEFSGRRINLTRHDESLLLTKPTGIVSHGGKQILSEDGEGATVLRSWIEQGAPFTKQRELKSLTITPQVQALEAVDSSVSLKATARYVDGSERDVTRWTVFEAEDASAVSIDEHLAHATVKRRGRHIIVARYLDQVIPIELFVPLGDEAVDLSLEPRHSFIDDEILRTLEDLRVRPSAMADDATFHRRVVLDLTGRLPTPEEVDSYVANGASKKREQLVDRLLATDAFVDLWAMRLGRLLRLRSQQDKNKATITPKAVRTYHAWISDGLRKGTGYDELARALLTGTGNTEEVGPAGFYNSTEDPLLQTEFMTEVFLGTRMRCANCHNHPLDKWTQDDFHGLTAIFAKVTRGTTVSLSPLGKAIHPQTGQPARMRVPGERFLPEDLKDGRAALAEWVTSKENSYFAKAIVNRLWQTMMGRGLVEPVDDFRATNPATHPALLDRLARDFVANGFDLRHTLKEIAMSAVYARSSKATPSNACDDRYYSHTIKRPLEPAVLADAISDVTGVSDRYGDEPLGTRAVQLSDASIRSDALDILGRCARGGSCEGAPAPTGALPRKLHLFNGELLNARISNPDSRLQTMLRAGTAPQDIVREHYRIALGRRPSSDEAAFWQEQVARATSNDERSAALEDFVWGLLSCSEFQTNH